jgi:hypothetical protein
MAQQSRPTLTLPVLATSAIAQYRGVGWTGAQATVAGQKIMGISRRPAAIGGELDVTAKGTAICESGAAITVGAALTMDASGRVVAAAAVAVATTGLTVAAGAVAVTSTAANGAIVAGTATVSGGDLPQYIVGYAMEAAGAAGAFIEVLMA